MKNMKSCMCRFLLSALVLLFVILLSGCWDRREVNDVALVLASGIDKEGDGIRISVLIPLPGNMGGATGGGGGSGGKKPFVIKEETGSSIREAVAKLQRGLPRKLFLGHRRVLLIGEEYARSGVDQMIDAVTRMPENRLTVFVAVTKGKAIDVLNANTRLERFSAEAIREILQSDSSLRVTLKDVAGQAITTGSDAYLPYVQLKETSLARQQAEDITVSGYALTHNSKMTAIAKGGASVGIRLLSGKFKPYILTLKGKNGGNTTLGITSAIVRIKPIIKNGKPSFQINVHSKSSIEEDMNIQRNYDDIGQRIEIEQLVEKSMKQDIMKALKLMQESNSDVIGFGQIANRAFPGLWQRTWKHKWDELFPNCSFAVSVDNKLHRIGMTKENLAKKEQ
ncbi:Ger(x)C family spore germination protein [Paenibacillus mendelii]|uniref:Ger(X)C family spore germination protein n=1 Tax=Paenibacillus mendelii TaxID=206163 RepID=A0ABV6JEP2_9BACL|nr:Ger(x)C family spore germination protein [Paenibacillus mendelii]MCQ6557258.1 Ger(x)C family spore germination protein [Paenibacillus mendelii]